MRKLALFGSALRDDFREDSDVDVLVEFELCFHPSIPRPVSRLPLRLCQLRRLHF